MLYLFRVLEKMQDIYKYGTFLRLCLEIKLQVFILNVK